MKSLTTVIEVLESCQNDAIECFECPMRHETECEVKSVALAYLKEYQSAKDDLDEKRLKYMNAIAEFEDNPVLTWEQLKAMEGKPVWIEYGNNQQSRWAIIYGFHGRKSELQYMLVSGVYPDTFWQKDMGADEYWQAYRQERK